MQSKKSKHFMWTLPSSCVPQLPVAAGASARKPSVRASRRHPRCVGPTFDPKGKVVSSKLPLSEPNRRGAYFACVPILYFRYKLTMDKCKEKKGRSNPTSCDVFCSSSTDFKTVFLKFVTTLIIQYHYKPAGTCSKRQRTISK